jgi:hypothetical protein
MSTLLGVALDVVFVTAVDALRGAARLELVALNVLVVVASTLLGAARLELVALNVVVAFYALLSAARLELVALDVVVAISTLLGALAAHRPPDAAAAWLVLAHLYLHVCSNSLALARSDSTSATCQI